VALDTINNPTYVTVSPVATNTITITNPDSTQLVLTDNSTVVSIMSSGLPGKDADMSIVATTGSNRFIGNQEIIGDVIISGSDNVNSTIRFISGSVITAGGSNIDMTAGPGGWSEIGSNNGQNYVWVDDEYVRLVTNWNIGAHIWKIDMNGDMTAGGSIDMDVYGITGSLLGSSSYSTLAISSSYAVSASNSDLLDGYHASVFATTGSNTFIGNQILTGSLNLSGSINITNQINNSTMILITSSYNSGTAGTYHRPVRILTGYSGTSNITGFDGLTSLVKNVSAASISEIAGVLGYGRNDYIGTGSNITAFGGDARNQSGSFNKMSFINGWVFNRSASPLNNDMYGVAMSNVNSSGSYVESSIGLALYGYNSGRINELSGVGIYFLKDNVSGGVMATGSVNTTVYGLKIGSDIHPWDSAAYSNASELYGIYIHNSVYATSTTSSYAIYSDTHTPSYFSGSVAIGKRTPTTALDVVGTITATSFSGNGSMLTGISINTSSLATTGSNTFNGTQILSGSMYITGDMIVYGSSSIQNITASVVSIGTNTVILNTNTPAVRWAGLKVYDSGSSGQTGSLLWDSTNNVWIYENPDGGAYTSARFISGPKNTGSLGSEAGLTVGTVTVAVGDDHIGDSIITQNGTSIVISGNLISNSITGSLFGTATNSISASYALTASYALNTIQLNTGSYALTGSNIFIGNQTITGSLRTSGGITGSLMGTSSYSVSSLTASYALSGMTGINTASLATTGSNTFNGTQIVTGSNRGNITSLLISSNTASMDLSSGNFFTLQLVAGTNTYINPSNILPGQTSIIVVSSIGSATVSFPPNVKQPSGSAYVPTTSTGVDILTLASVDASTLYVVSAKNMI
jgi:hypothetical protein